MNGYKTYLVAAASLIYAGLGYFVLHNMDAGTALTMAQTAVMGAFIRHGVSTGA